MDKSFTLLSPIKDATGNDITAVTLHEPTAGEIEMAESQSKNGAGSTINIMLISLCSGLNPVTVRALKVRDYRAITSWIEGFLGDAPTTGAS